jgi:hypothetical protein
MRLCIILCTLGLAGCGDSSPSPAPSPTQPPPAPTAPPTPQTTTIAGTITDTVTGAVVGSFSRTATSLPAQVTVSAPGYITRETWVQTASPRVDLFPENGFDLRFYRQFARDDLDHLGGAMFMYPLLVLREAPAFYLEVEGAKGVTVDKARQLEAVARRIVPLITGGRFQVTRWETGPTPREPQPGWIMIERRDDADACGRAFVGRSAGQIWLNNDSGCRMEATFAHEIGHAFGFFHVDRPGSMMWGSPDKYRLSASDAPTDTERYHAALAYSRQRGNTDIDIDPRTSNVVQAPRVLMR